VELGEMLPILFPVTLETSLTTTKVKYSKNWRAVPTPRLGFGSKFSYLQETNIFCIGFIYFLLSQILISA
jgi:hypothetical protein